MYAFNFVRLRGLTRKLGNVVLKSASSPTAIVNSAEHLLTWSQNWFSKLEPSLTTLTHSLLHCPAGLVLVSIFNCNIVAAFILDYIRIVFIHIQLWANK